MKPPICALCGKRVVENDTDDEAGLVAFADYEVLSEGVVGHPKGLAWFCDEHYGAAEALRALPLDAALARLRERLT